MGIALIGQRDFRALGNGRVFKDARRRSMIGKPYKADQKDTYEETQQKRIRL